MAKRYIDSDIWDKRWFRELPPELKCVWIFLFTKCTHAGILEVDEERWNFEIGAKINKAEILETFNGKIIEFCDGKKWFLPKFVEYQYGLLDKKNRVHASVISHLKDSKIPPEKYKTLVRVAQGSKNNALGSKDKNKDKNKDKDKDKDPDKEKDKEKNIYITK